MTISDIENNVDLKVGVVINRLINNIVKSYKNILCDNLVGMYLHGSLAMNCFNPNVSDIDFLVIVKDRIENDKMKSLIKVLLDLSNVAPKKGFEMSVILENDVKNFKYPTPFLLHYSNYYKERYLKDSNYICRDGQDIDLAAHMNVIKERGILLYGERIEDMFYNIPKEYYIKSIKSDILNSDKEIENNPVYYILNLCRVLYFLTENKVSSKIEGGEWACLNIEEEYKGIVGEALYSYRNLGHFEDYEGGELRKFAKYMLKKIKNL